MEADILIRIVVLLYALWRASAKLELFHGTTAVIMPSNETFSPAGSTILAANFFCYMTDVGYFSFGWYALFSPHLLDEILQGSHEADNGEGGYQRTRTRIPHTADPTQILSTGMNSRRKSPATMQPGLVFSQRETLLCESQSMHSLCRYLIDRLNT